MEESKISLIIPIYNTQEHLEKCLQSAISQKYDNMEFICIDDGSTDGAGAILDAFAAEDDRIIAVHQENKGESAARNRGLKLMSGDYYGFLDCDDWIEPDMYFELINAAKEADADMAVGGWLKEYETYSQSMPNRRKLDSNILERHSLMMCVYMRDDFQRFAYAWDKLYRRELAYDKDGELILFDTDLSLGGDVVYLARMLLNSNKAVYIDKEYYHYRQRTDSGCRTENLERRLDWIHAYEIILELFEKEGIEEDVLLWVRRFMAYHCSNVAEIAFQQKREFELEYCKEKMRRYKDEYIQTNAAYPDRLQRYDRILKWQV
jgi:Glycosyltransferases, probably involved in cell wall biogenesis